MAENFVCDNSGNRIPPHPFAADPVAASGITISGGVAGSDVTQALDQGQMYIFTGLGGNWLISFTGATSTAANIEWVCPANQTIILRAPIGCSTLYTECDGASKKAYMRKLA